MNFVFRCLQLSMDLLTTVFSSFFPPFALLSFVLLLLFFLSELRISLPSYPFFYGLFLLILFFFFYTKEKERARERKKKVFSKRQCGRRLYYIVSQCGTCHICFFFFPTTGSPILTPFFFFFFPLHLCLRVCCCNEGKRRGTHTTKKKTNEWSSCVCVFYDLI